MPISSPLARSQSRAVVSLLVVTATGRLSRTLQATACSESARAGDGDAFGELCSDIAPPVAYMITSRVSDPFEVERRRRVIEMFCVTWRDLQRPLCFRRGLLGVLSHAVAMSVADLDPPDHRDAGSAATRGEVGNEVFPAVELGKLCARARLLPPLDDRARLLEPLAVHRPWMPSRITTRRPCRVCAQSPMPMTTPRWA